MESLEELAQLASLVRGMAQTVASEITGRRDCASSAQLSPKEIQTAKSELGLAFQCLTRAAHSLGVDDDQEE